MELRKTSCNQCNGGYRNVSLLLVDHVSLKRPFQLILALLGCLHLCGGPLGFMQVIAWAGMTVTYSAQDGIVEGVKKTFDGDHPCPLCCAIAKAKLEQEKSRQHQVPVNKEIKVGKEMSCLELVSLPEPSFKLIAEFDFYMESFSWEMIASGPPAPPPRLMA